MNTPLLERLVVSIQPPCEVIRSQSRGHTTKVVTLNRKPSRKSGAHVDNAAPRVQFEMRVEIGRVAAAEMRWIGLHGPARSENKEISVGKCCNS